MPVGPHILCEDATNQSAPSCCTSIGMLGTLWQASTSSLPPTYAAPQSTVADEHTYFANEQEVSEMGKLLTCTQTGHESAVCSTGMQCVTRCKCTHSNQGFRVAMTGNSLHW